MIYFLLRNLAKALFVILFRLEAQGKDNIPIKGGFILASNHISYLDPIALGVASGRVLNYMARDSLFSDKLFAWLLKNINVFPLKRKQADLGALRGALRRLAEGKGLVLFPEGTRSLDNNVNKFLDGVGFLSSRSNCPIVPAYIKGTNQVLPKGNKSIRLHKINVFFGKPIYPQEFSLGHQRDGYKMITDKTLQVIKSLESENN